MSPTLACRVRTLRSQQRLTQTQLAGQSAITVTYVSRIESGQRPNVGGYVLARLSAALRTSADYLLGATDDPRPVAQLIADAGLSADDTAFVRTLCGLPPTYRTLARHQIDALLRVLSAGAGSDPQSNRAVAGQKKS